MIQKKFNENLEKLLFPKKLRSYQAKKLVVGVSGGPDSMCLLHLLIKYANENENRCELIVAHLNHGLRGKEADQDADFVRRQVKKYSEGFSAVIARNEMTKQSLRLPRFARNDKKDSGQARMTNRGIKFITKKVDTKKYAQENKLNLEEAGRKLRYEFFDEVLKKEKADFVLTAHTLDDQVETVLMRFLRGSGVTGLAGILPKRNKILRPMLNISRAEVLAYCKKNKIQYQADKTNFDLKILRNKIRLTLIPILQKYNPNFKTSAIRMAETFGQYSEDLLRQAKRGYKKCLISKRKGKIILDLKKWLMLSGLYKIEVLRQALRELLGDTMGFEQVHFEEMRRLLLKSEPKKYKNLPRKIRLTKLKDRFTISYQ